MTHTQLTNKKKRQQHFIRTVSTVSMTTSPSASPDDFEPLCLVLSRKLPFTNGRADKQLWQFLFTTAPPQFRRQHTHKHVTVLAAGSCAPLFDSPLFDNKSGQRKVCGATANTVRDVRALLARAGVCGASIHYDLYDESDTEFKNPLPDATVLDKLHTRLVRVDLGSTWRKNITIPIDAASPNAIYTTPNVCWHPFENLIAVAWVGPGVKIWRVCPHTDVYECIGTLSYYSETIYQVRWSRDGQYIAGDAGPVVVMWKHGTFNPGEIVWKVSGVGGIYARFSWAPVYPSEIAPQFHNKTLFAVSCWDNSVRVHIVGRAERRNVIETNGISCFAWHPSRPLLAVGYRSGVCLWDVVTAQHVKRIGMSRTPDDITWHPFTNVLACYCVGNIVFFVDTDSPDAQRRVDLSGNIAWHPSGKVVGCGSRTSVCLYEWNSREANLGKLVWERRRAGELLYCFSVDWNSNGRMLASVTCPKLTRPFTLQVWY